MRPTDADPYRRPSHLTVEAPRQRGLAAYGRAAACFTALEVRLAIRHHPWQIPTELGGTPQGNRARAALSGAI
jgi:hypothetical protein